MSVPEQFAVAVSPERDEGLAIATTVVEGANVGLEGERAVDAPEELCDPAVPSLASATTLSKVLVRNNLIVLYCTVL